MRRSRLNWHLCKVLGLLHGVCCSEQLWRCGAQWGNATCSSAALSTVSGTASQSDTASTNRPPLPMPMPMPVRHCKHQTPTPAHAQTQQAPSAHPRSCPCPRQPGTASTMCLPWTTPMPRCSLMRPRGLCMQPGYRNESPTFSSTHAHQCQELQAPRPPPPPPPLR